jgi:hypothetical protein
MTTPRIFISYSHDSEEHKAWVADLARFLISVFAELERELDCVDSTVQRVLAAA